MKCELKKCFHFFNHPNYFPCIVCKHNPKSKEKEEKFVDFSEKKKDKDENK